MRFLPPVEMTESDLVILQEAQPEGREPKARIDGVRRQSYFCLFSAHRAVPGRGLTWFAVQPTVLVELLNEGLCHYRPVTRALPRRAGQ